MIMYSDNGCDTQYVGVVLLYTKSIIGGVFSEPQTITDKEF